MVAALSRLRFVMTGSHDENGMLAILKAAREAIQWVGTTSAPAPWCGGTASGFRSIGRPSSCGWPTRLSEGSDAYTEAWLDTGDAIGTRPPGPTGSGR